MSDNAIATLLRSFKQSELSEEASAAAWMIVGHLNAPRVGGRLQPRIKAELAADLYRLERALG
jgi:hypothetical protein